MPDNQSKYAPVADAAAKQYGLPSSLFQWQIGQESSWNPNASNGNAQGIAQFMPGTAQAFGVDVTDPVSSIYGAAAYDASLFSKSGSYASMLNHYGTVTASSPRSVVDAANAQLAAVGASAIPGTTPPAAASSPSSSTTSAIVSAIPGGAVLSGAFTAAKDAVGLGSAADTLKRYTLERGVYILLGLMLIAGGLYLLKPVQEVVNTAATKGIGAAAKGAVAAALL